MPSVYDFKPRFQALLRPIVRRAVAAGLTPNHITLIALGGSLLAGAGLVAAREQPRVLLLLPAWLFARMALNAMDGMAAREHGLATRLGGALNEIGDVVSDLALYVPIAFLSPALVWPAIAFSFGALLTEFCGVLGFALGSKRQYQGPMGKSDRALLVGALGLLGAIVPMTLSWWPAVLWVASVLALVTCRNRITGALLESPKGGTS
jgi:CDP-diacylglycerol---glycerol-3-phosphate 3-phosphatidyltransferase